MKPEFNAERIRVNNKPSEKAVKPFRAVIKNGCMVICILLFIFLCSCSNGANSSKETITPESSVEATGTPAAIPTETATTLPTEASTLTLTAEPSPTPSYSFIGQAVCSAKKSVNIRKEASESSEVTGALPSGEIVDVIEYKDKWAYIVCNGIVGYVSMDYLLKLYTPATPVPDGEWDQILVNPSHYLPNGFKVKTASFKGGKVDKRILDICKQMFADAKKDGVTFKLVDAYRSYAIQKKQYQKKVNEYIGKGYNKEEAEKEAATITARPNTSEHQTGLALDIVTPSYTKRDKGFAKTKAFKWLDENAFNYGFTMRYKADKVSITKVIYEPWHWRFVGVKAAVSMKISGKCLEEYLGETK